MITIVTEQTDNENIMKFIASRTLVEGSYTISNFTEAENIPMAQTLLNFPFIENIYITANFIAIEKNKYMEWDNVLEELKEVIEDEILANPEIIVKAQSRPISVYMEMTPNGDVMKFVNSSFIIDGMLEIKNKSKSKDIPLAEYLFTFPYVKEVFIYNNFVSIMKNEGFVWDDISMEIRQNLSTYLESEKEITNVSPITQKNNDLREYSEVESKIKTILEEYVLPAVSSDGGNIDLISYDAETKTAYMILQGACSGCPSSTITLKNGIEQLLNQMLPDDVNHVEAING